MLIQLRISIMMLCSMTVLTGILYPLTITGIAQLVFPHQANGSLLIVENKLVGSSLIGQNFSDPKYFWGRLSATSPVPYNAAASSGSNMGPMHPSLKAATEKRIADLTAGEISARKIPVDLVTASASGIDPYISIAAAEFQVRRVATQRNMPEEQVRLLVAMNTHQRQFGVLGEPRIHVLHLNMALDQHSKPK